MMVPADDRALVPSQEQRPHQFSREDLEIVSGEFAAVDETEGSALQTARAAVASGAYTVERAAQVWGLSDAEKAALAKPPAHTRTPSALAEIEAELESIAALRKSDRRRYWSAEVQAREGELHAQAERLKGLPQPARDAAPLPTTADSTDVLEQLRTEFDKTGPGGAEEAFGVIRYRTTMLDELDDGGEMMRARFSRELASETQKGVGVGLADDQSYRYVASQAEVEAFAETEHGRAVMEEWERTGENAPRLLGRAIRERDKIMHSATARSQLELQRYYDRSSADERGQMVRILAARATRRL